jgi:hypothetical protein
MAPAHSSNPDLSTLGVLGFTAHEERLYRLVLRNSGSTVAGLAGLAGLPVGEMREHVSRFVRSGVVEVRDDVVVARPPQEALGRLISEEGRRVQSRAEQLEAARALLPSLHVDHLSASATTGRPVPVEVLEDGDLAQLVRSFAVSSSGDLLWLRPDPSRIPPGNRLDDWVIDLVRSGRRSRAIYPATALEESPGTIRARAEAGESIRVLAAVPTRLAVIGGTAALLSERFGVNDGRRLVLRQPSLVAAVTLMFEGLWDKALPVPELEGRPLEGGTYDEGIGGKRLLLHQLAGGAKDEQIARALGISLRTVRRRVAELLEDLGAGSRFQAGAEAVRRGWL